MIKRYININFAEANFDFHQYFDIDQKKPITHLPVKFINEKTEKTVQHAMDVFHAACDTIKVYSQEETISKIIQPCCQMNLTFNGQSPQVALVPESNTC